MTDILNNKKVAIVHDFLIKFGGAEQVLRVLCEIFPSAPIFTLIYDKHGTKYYFEDRKIITSYIQKYPRFLRLKNKFFIASYPKAIEKLDLSDYDIVISSSNSYAHAVKTAKKSYHIVYCYSPTRYLWDWYHNYLKEKNITFSPFALIIRFILSKVRIWDYRTSQNKKYWISISKNVQNRIFKYYRKQSTIIYPPFNKNFSKLADKTETTSDYYLVLSRLSKYKNVDLVVKAFNKNGKILKIIGEGEELNQLKKMALGNIEFLGFIKDERILANYLKNAKALIFPGEEDFGLTPIEAMSVGTPVIAYNKGGVSESVINNKTGLFFKYNKVSSINNTINYFEKNISNFSAKDCINRSEYFSTDNFKNNLKNYILKVLNDEN